MLLYSIYNFIQETVSLCNSCRRAIRKPPIVAWAGRGAAINIAASRAAVALAVPLAGAPVRFRRKAAAHGGAGLGRWGRQWRYRQRTSLMCLRKFCGLLNLLAGFLLSWATTWHIFNLIYCFQGVTMRCRLSWPTNSAKCKGEGGELRGLITGRRFKPPSPLWADFFWRRQMSLPHPKDCSKRIMKIIK
jgi:hypothetical protein